MRATNALSAIAQLVLAIAAILIAAPNDARAQDSAEDAFDRGREAMLRGDYAVGCPLLAESHAKDARLGVLFTLAECEWRWGKAAHAVAHYDAFLRAYTRGDVPRAAANDERQRIALARRTALAPRVAFVTLVPEASRTPPRVLINGEPVAAEDVGAELAVDPGVVRIASASEARPPIVLTLALGEHRNVMLTLLTMQAPPASLQPGPAPSPPIDRTQRSERGSLSPLAYVAGAIGLAGIGTGAVAGSLVIGKKGAIDAHCPNHRCDAEGLSDVNTAQSLGRVSTIGFVVGAAGLATATIAILMRPKGTTATAQLTVSAIANGLGAGLAGTW